VGILFPHIIEDARSKPHQTLTYCFSNFADIWQYTLNVLYYSQIRMRQLPNTSLLFLFYTVGFREKYCSPFQIVRIYIWGDSGGKVNILGGDSFCHYELWEEKFVWTSVKFWVFTEKDLLESGDLRTFVVNRDQFYIYM